MILLFVISSKLCAITNKKLKTLKIYNFTYLYYFRCVLMVLLLPSSLFVNLLLVDCVWCWGSLLPYVSVAGLSKVKQYWDKILLAVLLLRIFATVIVMCTVLYRGVLSCDQSCNLLLTNNLMTGTHSHRQCKQIDYPI